MEARWVSTKYGERLVAEMPDGSTVWTSALTEKGLAKRGLREVRVVKPAWAKIDGKGYNLFVRIYPARLNRATGEYN